MVEMNIHPDCCVVCPVRTVHPYVCTLLGFLGLNVDLDSVQFVYPHFLPPPFW